MTLSDWLLLLQQATVDPETAWLRILSMDSRSLQGGWAHHSKAAALYWAATRP